MKLAPFSLVSAFAFAALAAIGCGTAPRDDDGRAADAAADDAAVEPVVLNIGSDQLRVARFDLDLEVNIARFIEPAATLPLERVSIFGAGPDQEPEDLSVALERCNALWGYEVTGGAAFVVGQGEAIIDGLNSASGCVPCGFTLVCPGVCNDLGPGDVPRGDPSAYDTDPTDGVDTGVDNGGEDGGEGSGEGGTQGGTGGGGDDSSGTSSGSGGSTSGSSGSTSGGSTGGSGGASGGVGQPGGD